MTSLSSFSDNFIIIISTQVDTYTSLIYSLNCITQSKNELSACLSLMPKFLQNIIGALSLRMSGIGSNLHLTNDRCNISFSVFARPFDWRR